jgi:hypothetical protein
MGRDMSCSTKFSGGRVRSSPKATNPALAVLPTTFPDGSRSYLASKVTVFRSSSRGQKSTLYRWFSLQQDRRDRESRLFQSTEISTLVFCSQKFCRIVNPTNVWRYIYIYTHSLVPPSPKKICNSKFRIKQTFLRLIKYLEHNINIYISK